MDKRQRIKLKNRLLIYMLSGKIWDRMDTSMNCGCVLALANTKPAVC